MTQTGDAAVMSFDLRSGVKSVLEEAFLTAYLLTRSDTLAEQMVCLAIEHLDPPQCEGRALIAKTLTVCLELSRNATSAGSAGSRTLSMPEELQAVMELEPALRYCFVTRVLLDFPLRDCVALLQTDAVTITRCLIEATRRLCWRSEQGSFTYLPGAVHNEIHVEHSVPLA